MRIRKLVLGCFVVIGVVALVAIFLVFRFAVRLTKYGPVARELPHELEMARREGLPLTPDDLRPHPPIPDKQNAAILYQKIDNEWRALPEAIRKAEGDIASKVSKPDRTADDRQKARGLIVLREKWLRLSEAAAKMPHCDFHYRYELGPDLMLPEFATLRQITRLLAARAILESDDGHPETALYTLAIGAQIARHMNETPILIAVLVDVAMKAIIHRAFVTIMFANRDRPDIVITALGASHGLESPPNLLAAMRGEVIMGRAAVDIVRREHSSSRFIPEALRNKAQKEDLRNQMTDAWDVRFLQYQIPAFRAIKASRGDAMTTYRSLRTLESRDESFSGKATYELNEVLIAVYSQAALKMARCAAERDLRTTLIAIVKYRQQHGQYSDNLSQLPVPIPNDIFTGKPPIYRRTPDGFILYSVGENFKDDGGRAKESVKDKKDTDIVVQFPVR